MEEKTIKYIFGITAIISLLGIQLIAFYLGYNGQFTIIITNTITLILGFLGGTSLTRAMQSQRNSK